MPATYEPIATTTLGSAAASITFSSIPSTYTDLRITFFGRGDTSNPYYFMRLNGSTSTIYSETDLKGNGTSATSARNTNSSLWELSPLAASTTIPGFITVDIFSYAGSTNKTALRTHSLDFNGSGGVGVGVHLFRSTSAITSVQIGNLTGAVNFAAGTTATLYGILRA